ncbi:DNA replication and repair protein RecF [compost metagenome]
MYLSELSIWNFRKYGSSAPTETGKTGPGLSVKFNSDLNIIVGENDSGKTAIIDALKLVLTTQSNDFIKLEYEDFHLPIGETMEEKRTDSLEIQCIFRGLKPEEAKNFLEWLSFESIDKEKRYLLKVTLKGRRKGRRVYYDVKAGNDEDGSLMNSEARALLKSTYLKPLRDADYEMAPRKNSRLSQILDSHQAFEDKEHHHLKKVMLEANEMILNYFKGKDDKEVFEDQNGKQLLDKINTYLKEFSSTDLPLNSIFSISDMKLRTILEKLSLELSINKSGLGSQNLLFIAVELLLLNREHYTGLKVALVEEIEAHIHPQAQLRLIEFLQNESSDLGVQLILTTHSTVLASKVPLRNLILCNNGKCFSMDSESTKLEIGDYSFLERFLDSTKANLFFAKGVILVEGDAEHLLVPTIAELIGRPLSKHGTTIVNVGSTAFLRYCRIFQRKNEKIGKMNIPVSIITDNDVEPVFSSSEVEILNIDQVNPSRQKKINLYNGQTVSTFVSPFWTLEYDLIAGGNLTKEFYRAVLYAKKIQNSEKYGLTEEKRTQCDNEVELVLKEWADSGFSKEKIAYEIYKNVMLKNSDTVSKAITAQCLAEILSQPDEKKAFRAKILENPNLKYIVDAIIYATNHLEGEK